LYTNCHACKDLTISGDGQKWPTSDPDYDSRIIDALKIASRHLNFNLPVSECISQISSSIPDHLSSEARLTPKERLNTYMLDKEKILSDLTNVLIVDDVLTTGSHFKGIELAIYSVLPSVKVTGLFVARTVRVNPFEDFDLSLLDL